VSLDSYIRAAPKAELHVHLEGAIQPATLLALARRNRVTLPADDEAGLRRWFQYRDFPHFIEIFLAATSCLRSVDDYELIAYEFGAEMARQNVRYAEAHFAPSTHHWQGVPQDVWFSGLTRGRLRAAREFGVQIRWVFNIVRASSEPETLFPKAEYCAAVAIDGLRDGVVALSLAGNEAAGPPEPFAPYFERALAAGLHSYPHAGEHAGPASIRGALDALHAERIAHGVRAIEEPALLAELVARGIALDVCPTSNLCLGVSTDLATHPLPRLLAAGVRLTINSDDPPLFNTTLNDEAALLGSAFALDVAAIDAILLEGVRASFLPEVERSVLEQRFRGELDALKAVHLSAELR
jgi:aminodeoxyfutalosine deaminase